MCTNNLVIFSFRSLAKILVGVSFNKMVWKLSHGDSRARASTTYIALLESSSVNHGLGRVGLEIALYKKTSVPSLVLCLDPIVKIRIV